MEGEPVHPTRQRVEPRPPANIKENTRQQKHLHSRRMSNTSTTDQSRNETNYCLGNLAGRPEGRGSAAFSKIVNSHRIKDAFFLGT